MNVWVLFPSTFQMIMWGSALSTNCNSNENFFITLRKTLFFLKITVLAITGHSVPIPRILPFSRLRCGFCYQADLNTFLYLYLTVE